MATIDRVGLPDPDLIIATTEFTPRGRGATATAARAGVARYRIITLRRRSMPIRASARRRRGGAFRPESGQGARRQNLPAPNARPPSCRSRPPRSRTSRDISSLLASLPKKDPKGVSEAAGSKRIPEEQRNVRVRAFLYAASREPDNDFHLIVGDDPAAAAPKLMTMEISGLPPSSSASFARSEGRPERLQGLLQRRSAGPRLRSLSEADPRRDRGLAVLRCIARHRYAAGTEEATPVHAAHLGSAPDLQDRLSSPEGRGWLAATTSLRASPTRGHRRPARRAPGCRTRRRSSPSGPSCLRKASGIGSCERTRGTPTRRTTGRSARTSDFILIKTTHSGSARLPDRQTLADRRHVVLRYGLPATRRA